MSSMLQLTLLWQNDIFSNEKDLDSTTRASHNRKGKDTNTHNDQEQTH